MDRFRWRIECRYQNLHTFYLMYFLLSPWASRRAMIQRHYPIATCWWVKWSTRLLEFWGWLERHSLLQKQLYSLHTGAITQSLEILTMWMLVITKNQIHVAVRRTRMMCHITDAFRPSFAVAIAAKTRVIMQETKPVTRARRYSLNFLLDFWARLFLWRPQHPILDVMQRSITDDNSKTRTYHQTSLHSTE